MDVSGYIENLDTGNLAFGMFSLKVATGTFTTEIIKD